MNSNNKELSRISLLLSLAVVITIASYYIPVLGILSFVSGSIFMIIALISNKKAYMMFSLIIYFLIVLFFVEPVSACIFTFVFALPCTIMGHIMKKRENEDIAYLSATVVMAVAIMLMFTVFIKIFNFDFFEYIKLSFDLSIKQLKAINPNYKIPEAMNSDFIVSITKKMFPSIMLIFSFLMTLLSKYAGIFILKRIFPREDYNFKPFREFVVPEKLGLFFIVFYGAIYILSYLKILDSSYSDRLISNVLYLMIYMLVIQGLAVIFYFINKLNKIARVFCFFAVFLLFQTLFVAIAFIAILDMTFDFRKIRVRSVK